MSNEDFRRELNRAFDDVTGSPSSNLSDRVRSAVGEAPRVREPYWIAGVAAAVIAVLIVGVLFVANPFRQAPSTAGSVHSPSPSPSASATPQESPTASPNTQPFVCTSSTTSAGANGTPPPVVYVSALRTGAHPGYDRLTVEFTNGTPAQVKLGVQSGTRFLLSPSGVPTTLKGQKGILVVMYGTDLHTSYTGPTDIVTGYTGLAEVKRIEDFEGTVQLGLGVNGAACYRVMWLTNPNRLVIDVQSP
ncbi:MAG TPA: hypothetical protein VJR46_12825 [Candidatus Dormibacteraeota bacterium]|nr:hypothetical protein [Candidatus Dormibacteraeota bacterium]